jgi:hypothetical protein
MPLTYFDECGTSVHSGGLNYFRGYSSTWNLNLDGLLIMQEITFNIEYVCNRLERVVKYDVLVLDIIK